MDGMTSCMSQRLNARAISLRDLRTKEYIPGSLMILMCRTWPVYFTGQVDLPSGSRYFVPSVRWTVCTSSSQFPHLAQVTDLTDIITALEVTRSQDDVRFFVQFQSLECLGGVADSQNVANLLGHPPRVAGTRLSPVRAYNCNNFETFLSKLAHYWWRRLLGQNLFLIIPWNGWLFLPGHPLIVWIVGIRLATSIQLPPAIPLKPCFTPPANLKIWLPGFISSLILSRK